MNINSLTDRPLKEQFGQFWNDHIHAFQYTQILRYLASVIMSIMLVNSSLLLQDIGIYEIIMLMALTVSFFWQGGIKDALINEYAVVEGKNQVMLVQKYFLIMVLAACCAGILVFIFSDYLAVYFLDSAKIPFPGWLTLYIVFGATSIFGEIVLMLKRRTKAIYLFSSIFFVVTLVSFSCGLYFFKSIESILISLVLVSVLKTAGSVFFVFEEGIASFKVIMPVSWRKPVGTFMLLALMSQAMDLIDSLLAVHYFSKDFFPVFRYGARELPFSILLMSSLSAALIPVLAGSEDIGYLKRKVNMYMHIFFPGSILLMVLSPVLFTFFYSPAFETSAHIFNIYLFIIGSRLLLPHTMLLARGYRNEMIISGVIEIVINIVLSLWWINIWGVYGLVFATVVAYLMQKMVLLYYLRKYLKLGISDIIDVRWYVVYHILAVFVFLVIFLNK